MTKLLNLWYTLRASLWFVPGALVLLAVGLAIALIEVDSRIDRSVLEAWPRLFGAGAAGSRGMLATVAASMITIAGVVFSITLVALALASGQYTSRVLRTFMSDRTNQTVLGVFLGIFSYCLVVLRTIRDGEDSAFVPSLAVLGGGVLAFVGISYFIFFIHHIATSIQAANILARIAAETTRRVDHLFPEGVGEEADDNQDPDPPSTDPQPRWRPVPSHRTGYIQGVNPDALLAVAREHSTVIRMRNRVGDFVIEGTVLAFVRSAQEPPPAVLDRVSAAYTIDQQRTSDQDVAYGVRQIVDVALKALSPGINDTTTAVMCLDYLTAILFRLANRRIESPYRFDEAVLRVITRGVTFADLVELSFDQIRQNAGGNVAVLARLLEAIQLLQSQTQSTRRRRALLRQAEALAEAIRRTIPAAIDREPLEARAAQLLTMSATDPGAT